MAITHSFIINFQSDNGTSQSLTTTQTNDGALTASVVIPAASSNLQVIFPLTATLVRSVLMWTDAAMTVVNKNGASTVNTFTMVASKPLIWQTGFPYTNPITGDFTHLHVTSTPGGNLYIQVLEDI